MNFPTYRAIPAINASSLKWAAVSPLHYRYYRDNDRPDTAAMQLGRAVHTACLEPDQFALRYTTWHKARRGSDWAEFRQATESAGLEVLTDDEYLHCLAIRDAVRAHPVAARLLGCGKTEETLVWVDEATGLQCKARCDVVDIESAIVTDLKTARAIDPRQFGRATYDLLYHVQAAHYLAGAKAKWGRDWSFAFIAVESAPPFDVRAGRLSEDALYAGEQERRRLLELVASCTASDEWPGAYPTESEFDLPAWFYAEGDKIMEATL